MVVSISEAVGQQVAQARLRRGWTQQRLGDQLRAVDPNTKLNRAAVAKIESGVRGVTLDEVVLLAAALHVPPVALLLPLGTDDAVRVTSEMDLGVLSALGWFVGDKPLWDDEDGWLEGVRPLELYRKLRDQLRKLQGLEALAKLRERQGDDAEAADIRREAESEGLKDLHGVLRDLQAARLRIPPLPADYIDGMERQGLDVAWLRRRGEVG